MNISLLTAKMYSGISYCNNLTPTLYQQGHIISINSLTETKVVLSQMETSPVDTQGIIHKHVQLLPRGCKEIRSNKNNSDTVSTVQAKMVCTGTHTVTWRHQHHCILDISIQNVPVVGTTAYAGRMFKSITV